MTSEQLLTELDKPAYAALRTARNDAAIAAMLNTVKPDFTVWKSVVTRAELLSIVVGLNAYPSLLTARDTVGSPARSLAFGFLLMLENPLSEIDATTAGNQSLIAAMDNIHEGLTAGIESVAKRPGTVAESIAGVGVVVSVNDVSDYLNSVA
jgi:hypothetical protein